MPWIKTQPPQPETFNGTHELAIGGLLNRLRVILSPYGEGETHCVLASIDYCEAQQQEIITEQGIAAAKREALAKFREFAVAQLAMLDEEIARQASELTIDLKGVGEASDVSSEQQPVNG